ncbi:MAG: acyl-CoA carboxylase subunit beta [Cumulibacter sp.]
MTTYASLEDSTRELRARRSAVLDAQRGDELERQRKLDKFTARERIDMLVDTGTFREFGVLVDTGKGDPGREKPIAAADGVVTGIGQIDGRPAAIVSYDFSIFGGSSGVAGGRKIGRAVERAGVEGIPLVMLMDGGGHRIQEGLDSHHFASGTHGFKDMTDLSGAIPIVAVLMGPGFAGPSNHAAFADFVVMVKGTSTMGIAGPALVEAATGEQISNEDLGGAKIQAALGVTDIAVNSEEEAMDAVRLYLDYLPSNATTAPPLGASREPSGATGIDEVVPADPKTIYDVHDVIDGLVDADSVFSIKEEYARNVVTAFARLGGRAIGVVANQPSHLGGTLDSPACEKAAHFISVCDAFGLPLLFLIDIPGFLVGTESAVTQLARRSGRLMFEMGQATVPLLSVVMRKGYGAGYVAMGGGRSYDADASLAWPTAEISAMSIPGAVDVAYRREVAAADDPTAHRQALIDEFTRHVGPFYAARGFGFDELVLPSETRAVLIDTLKRVPHRHRSSAAPRIHAISPI